MLCCLTAFPSELPPLCLSSVSATSRSAPREQMSTADADDATSAAASAYADGEDMLAAASAHENVKELLRLPVSRSRCRQPLSSSLLAAGNSGSHVDYDFLPLHSMMHIWILSI